MKISVLGTVYTVEVKSESEDDYLEKCDGYCDKTTKRIVVHDMADSDLGEPSEAIKKVKRHEIIHAFLFESGLHENWEHKGFGHEETTVDWIAVQFHKLLEAFKDADAI